MNYFQLSGGGRTTWWPEVQEGQEEEAHHHHQGETVQGQAGRCRSGGPAEVSLTTVFFY